MAMLPDIVTQKGGFISPTHGYQLNIHKSIGMSEHELFFRNNNTTCVLFAGTEEECQQKLWDLVIAITGLMPQEEQASIVTLGPPVPPEHYAPTPCPACKKKRKRIKKLEGKVKRLKAHQQFNHETVELALAKLDSLSPTTITELDEDWDTSKPSQIPQIGIIEDTDDLIVDIELLHNVEYYQKIRITKSMSAHIVTRKMVNDMSGWEILVKTAEGTLRAVCMVYFGSKTVDSRNVKYYKSYLSIKLDVGDVIVISPNSQSARDDVIASLRKELDDETQHESDTDGQSDCTA